MDYKEFMTYMDASGTSQKEAIAGLQNYVHEFPYFQTAQALLAKAFREQEHVRFDKQLKIAAAYCSDRKSLYALIHHRPSSIFVESTPASPFVSSPVLTTPIQEENIFAESPVVEENVHAFPEAIEETTVSSNTTSVPTFEIADSSGYDEVEEILPEPKEVSTLDPHDIIKQRLKEILTKKENTEEKDKNSITDQKHEEVEPVTSIISEEKVDTVEIKNAVISEEKSSEIEQPFSGIEKEEQSINVEVPSLQNEAIDVKVEPEVAENKTEEIIQLISKESEHRKDDVDRGELEYALEATIIQSLEHLPLLDEAKKPKQEAKAPSNETPVTFFDWLKQKQGETFGKVEEIHAYDSPSEVESQSEHSELSVKTKESNFEVEESEKGATTLPAAPVKIPESEALIDKFIAEEPRIVPSKTEFYSPAKQAQKSLIEHEDLVSETLARIYRLQGALLKARSAYQKLILLHPEKKAYFAALIEEIDNQYNNPDKQDL